MTTNRSVRSRKKDANSKTVIDNKRAAKSSLINKVNAEKENVTSSRSSDSAKRSLQDKVNSEGKTRDNRDLNQIKGEAKKLSKDDTTINSKNIKKDNKDDKKKKNKKPLSNRQSKFRNSFFFKLSKIGRIQLVIYCVGILIFAILFGRAMMNKGHVVLGSRQEAKVVIKNDEIEKVKTALDAALPSAESVDVQYVAYRLVVVIDMPDSSDAAAGKKANYAAYREINKILPIKTYFSSEDTLNNDLFIYSSDVIPKDYETNSKYIFQTYKNSKMAKPSSYNLLTPRDKKSAQEVLETMDKANS
ncbi:hypothetical protein LJB88_01600 [Erysipelotrichaceae bacterium OttesenSCG-928-M19]|nr:hypothetical protein [Erysipelotrichaceae bacterium OttesenSCG-928-M19]